MLACPAIRAQAQTFLSNARAAGLVTSVVLDDFHTAQAGGSYVFSYDRNETDDTLTAKLVRWFSGKEPGALRMHPGEKQTLFNFYWAACMMPPNSPCFAAMTRDGCQDQLSTWIARASDDDPRFVDAYESARKPLGLPPLGR
ncbi:hypothetical protein [Candidatus Burkholderia verschuerenii]|uniref:hypothetical protein n=1 Tax=Candidatus Burkholderia verschuerenii TaxID=242163 RepID=UPI00067DDB1A|nr:hypothetical protein [Candidatus Burkholderia verschuerenii]